MVENSEPENSGELGRKIVYAGLLGRENRSSWIISKTHGGGGGGSTRNRWYNIENHLTFSGETGAGKYSVGSGTRRLSHFPQGKWTHQSTGLCSVGRARLLYHAYRSGPTPTPRVVVVLHVRTIP